MENTDTPIGNDFGLPAYTVRRSKRARRIGLRVIPGRGLEVVLPLHVALECVPDIIQQYDSWIRRALERMTPPGQPSGNTTELPIAFFIKGGAEKIILSRGSQAPALSSLPAESSGVGYLTQSVKERHVFFKADKPLPPGWLHSWIREEARSYLGDMLAAQAAKHGFSYGGLSIRFQRTRWGSCSAKGHISLNGCLLFLPENLVRYILLHELCHTRQLNHSEKYWKVLFSIEPDALALDKAMRRAWKHVPAWVFVAE